jgi:ribosome-associated heat shock protein Hsp15
LNSPLADCTLSNWQRLDKFLWCARFASQRTACAAMAESGLIRINRQPTDKPHAKIRAGDVLTLPLHSGVRVIRVLALSDRRGNAASARALYEEVGEISRAEPGVQELGTGPETLPDL